MARRWHWVTWVSGLPNWPRACSTCRFRSWRSSSGRIARRHGRWLCLVESWRAAAGTAHVAVLMIYLATGAAGICMTTLLYRSRLIPRSLAILGLVTYPTLLAGTVLDMFNVVDVTQGIGLVALVPGALFEFILPVWLIVKGFTFPDHD